MELKRYQKKAVEQLENFLQELRKHGPKRAFMYVTEKPYQSDSFGEVPFVCVKIPTGGGKTLVGCQAVEKIMSIALQDKLDRGIVLWFTPSEAIKTQTLKKFKDRKDWHRRLLDESFDNNVKVFSNEEALAIRKEDIDDNLCVIVSSLDAFRKEKTKQNKYKVYQENGALLDHFQNIEEAFTRLEQRLLDESPLRMACFVCLNTKCVSRNGMPVFYLGQDEKRLTTPKLMRRTQQLVNLLDETTVPYKIDILIADTDIYDVNSDWLDTPDQSSDIYTYQQKLSSIFSGISPNFDCKLWSEVQAPYEDQYRSDFNYVLNQYTGSNEEEVLINIAKRKRSLISQGVPDSDELERICRITSERNFALYAAQGPILKRVYDLVIMADSTPKRLCKKQSLLEPDLSIWCPYPD